MTIDPTIDHLLGNPLAYAGNSGDRVLLTVEAAHVVQLLDTDPAAPGARVIDIHPATVIVTAREISAIGGDVDWSWLTAELDRVVHAASDTWSILQVPGIGDFGVRVPQHALDRFRDVLLGLAGVRIDTQGDTFAPSTSTPQVAELLDTLGAPTNVGRVIDTVATDDEGTATPSRSLLGRLRERGAAPATDTLLAATPALTGIDARNISAWFGTHQVLDRVSLDMPAGQVTALIGPSGCGKSTFLRILNRMHEMIPAASMAGEVLIDGHDIYDPERKLTDARREIGMVFQKPNPFPAMSIYDNVLASLRLTGTKASTEMKDQIVESCLMKAGLWNEVRDRLRKPGGGLSGGQQQRLCIARALAIRPRVLLMDEPCSALDPTSTRRIEETIMELVSEVTIVIVTHNMQQAARVSNQCAFFLAEQGTPGFIVEHGPTSAMFSLPQDPRTNDYVNGRFG